MSENIFKQLFRMELAKIRNFLLVSIVALLQMKNNKSFDSFNEFYVLLLASQQLALCASRWHNLPCSDPNNSYSMPADNVSWHRLTLRVWTGLVSYLCPELSWHQLAPYHRHVSYNSSDLKNDSHNSFCYIEYDLILKKVFIFILWIYRL